MSKSCLHEEDFVLLSGYFLLSRKLAAAEIKATSGTQKGERITLPTEEELENEG